METAIDTQAEAARREAEHEELRVGVAAALLGTKWETPLRELRPSQG